MNKLPPYSTIIIFFTAFLFATCQRPIAYTEEQSGVRPKGEIEGAREYLFQMLKNPATGKIPPDIRRKELLQANKILQDQLRRRTLRRESFAENAYEYRGPDNIGGRTRSVAYDIRYNGSTNRVLMAGGVSGGIYKSTDDGATWVRKGSTSSVYSITSIAQDTRPGHENTWYYGTGEWYENIEGDGIFKSTDNGETWTKLQNSNNGVHGMLDRHEDFIWKVIVAPTGHVYFAGMAGIFRSTDGGNTWMRVLSSPAGDFFSYQTTDIVVAGNGTLYAGFGGYNAAYVDGVWTSTSGSLGSWTRIAGDGNERSPTGWDQESEFGRMVLALAPSNDNILYAYTNTFRSACPNATGKLWRWNNTLKSWTDLSKNLPGCSPGTLNTQAGYNMLLSVKPDDESVVFLGAVDLFRSDDAFSTADKISHIGGGDWSTSHADMHALAFRPGVPTTMLCVNDGGIQRTTNNMAQNRSTDWTPLNNKYRTLQYYYVALDPEAGSDRVIGGSQDNGTTKGTSETKSDFVQIFGGDGVSVGISKRVNNVSYEYLGYQFGNIFRHNENDGPHYADYIRPASATESGLFITLFLLDPDNTEHLYYVNRDRILRNLSASKATTTNWTELNGISAVVKSHFITALGMTRGSYNPATKSLFLGTHLGQLYRLDDPANADMLKQPVNITSGITNSGHVSSIAVNPRNDDTVLVTMSSYGVTSIWWTGNANSQNPTWTNVERELTLPSVRSAAIAITASGVEYFVGTSVGLFKSLNPLVSDWTQEGASTVGNAIVTSLFLRPADNRLLIGTYGYGMWSTSLSMPAVSSSLPLTLTRFNGQTEGNHSLLEWTTSMESNTSHFEVERGYDKRNFKKIAQVPASGYSNALKQYRLVDREPSPSVTYYRLKMVDRDEKFTWSETVMIRRQPRTQQLIISNPFYDHIDIRFREIPKGKIRWRLTDLSGKVVATKEHPPIFQPLLKMSHGTFLTKGVYFLAVEVDNEVFTRKLTRL